MDNIKYILHIIILFLIQLFILDNIQLNSYIYINIYILSIFIIPYNTKQLSVLLLSFLFGAIIDIFSDTMGIHAAAATCIGYLRPKLLASLTKTQMNEISSRKTSESGWFIKFSVLLILAFNIVLIMTETFSFANFGITLMRILFSTIASGILILLYYFIAIKEKQGVA